MGIEYRLRFSAPDTEAVASVLRRLPAAQETPSASGRFDDAETGLRREVSGSPDGTAFSLPGQSAKGRMNHAVICGE
jgi:hypothetical protein